MITYARGKSPYGPFESYPLNPVVTNRDLGGHQSRIQGIGHGDLVQTDDGSTFIVCLGFRQEGMWMPFHHLGREVFLVPVQWQEDGWFTAGVNGTVEAEMEMNLNAAGEDTCYDVSFEKLGADSLRWCHLRAYDKENYQFTENGVNLRGNHFTLDDVDAPTFLGVRQSEFDTTLDITVGGNSPEAGITFYLCEDHHYDLYLTQKDGVKKAELRFTIGDAQCVKASKALGEEQQEVSFHVESEGEFYTFFAEIDGESVELGKARTKYLSSEVAGGFTGTVMAMYAVNPQEDKDAWGTFRGLEWTMRKWVD